MSSSLPAVTLASVNVLVLASGDTSVNSTTVRNFVIAGNGLYTGGTTWAYNYPNGFDIALEYPGNNFALGSGLIFDGHNTIGSTVNVGTFTVSDNAYYAIMSLEAYAKKQVRSVRW